MWIADDIPFLTPEIRTPWQASVVAAKNLSAFGCPFMINIFFAVKMYLVCQIVKLNRSTGRLNDTGSG